MSDAPSRKLSWAVKRRTYQTRDSFTFQTEPANEGRKMLVLEGDDKVEHSKEEERHNSIVGRVNSQIVMVGENQ